MNDQSKAQPKQGKNKPKDDKTEVATPVDKPISNEGNAVINNQDGKQDGADKGGEGKKARLGLYDNFRGIAVILYVISMMSNIVKQFSLPYWMIHTWSPEDIKNQPAGATQQLIPFFNITIADLGPIFFYFIVGLTCVWAFRRRKEMFGLKSAYAHVLYRNLAIIGVSCVMIFLFNALARLGNPDARIIDWNQLASIGMVGLMLMPFLNKSKWTRLISGVVVLIVYQIFLKQIIGLLGGEEGGIAACFGFLGATLIITFFADLQREKGLLWLCVAVQACLAVAVILSWLMPANYRDFDTTYQVVALGFVSQFFLLYALIDKYLIKKAIPFVSWMGKNMFLYYLILQVARVLIKKVQGIINPDGVTVFGMVLVVLAMCAIFALISWRLEKRKFIFKL